MRLNLKNKARKLKTKIAALYLAYRRSDTPLIAKIVAAVTVGYALSPIDLIPDFIPVLGYLDDLILLPLLIALCLKLIPASIMAECEQQAIDLWKDGKPKRWRYAIPIVLVWLVIVGLLAYKIFF